MASLRELQDYYSLEDAYLMLECLTVKNFNTRLANLENQ